jgi:hypothetical protein
VAALLLTALSGPDHECVENMAGLVYLDGTTPREGMFFMLMDSRTCEIQNGNTEGLVGLDDDNEASEDDQAIVFAELTN